MDGLTEVSTAQLIDKLIVQHLKCWHHLDVVNEFRDRDTDTLTTEELKKIAKATQGSHNSNLARVALVDEINRRLSPGAFADRKSY